MELYQLFRKLNSNSISPVKIVVNYAGRWVTDSKVAPQVKMSLIVRKPAFCIYENKDADQLRGNRKADQRLCFHYTDSTIPVLSKSEIPSL